jgi:hypothetical protein
MPYIFYIHPWEIDPGQPRVAGIKATNWFRQRVNLHRCEERFAALVGAFAWIPICDLIDGWNVARRTAEVRGDRAADDFDGRPSQGHIAGPEWANIDPKSSG